MTNKFEFLKWDSDFLNLQVGKLSGSVSLENSENQLKILFNDNIDLIYYYTDSPINCSFSSNYFDYLLVDTKIPVKKYVESKPINPKITSCFGGVSTEELINLSQLAGAHTRFNLDPKISEEKFKELFKIWIEKSLDGSLATEVLVYKENDKIVGFVTAKLDDKIGYAPLLAVDRKYEGLGISFALMNAIQSYMYDNNCEILVSSTQSSNKKALKIYERWGCIFEDPVYVYHLWRKNPENQ